MINLDCVENYVELN